MIVPHLHLEKVLGIISPRNGEAATLIKVRIVLWVVCDAEDLAEFLVSTTKELIKHVKVSLARSLINHTRLNSQTLIKKRQLTPTEVTEWLSSGGAHLLQQVLKIEDAQTKMIRKEEEKKVRMGEHRSTHKWSQSHRWGHP